MKVLVIGATGFIGSNLVKALQNKPKIKQIVCLVRKKNHLPFDYENKKIKLLEGDFLKTDSIKGLFAGIDIVINCSGALGKHKRKASFLYQTNVKGVENLLAEAKRAKLKQFIHLSTAGVYGGFKNKLPSENTQLDPTNDYEKSKTLAEERFKTLATKHHISYTILRLELVYGPGDQQLLPLFRLINKGYFLQTGKGENRLQPTYIDDVIKGILLCVNNQKCQNQIYNLGGKIIFSKDLIKTIQTGLGVQLFIIKAPKPLVLLAVSLVEFTAGIFGLKPIVTRQRIRFFINNLGCDTSKIKQQLKFKPQIPLKKGIKKTIIWYKKEKLL